MKWRAWLLASVALLVVLGGAAHVFRLRFNPTRSVPRGVYRVTDAAVKRGDIVLICAPADEVFLSALQRGYLWSGGDCPGGALPLLKVAAALDGDVVVLGAEGVRINGLLWPRSRPLEADQLGRPLPSLAGSEWVLGGDQVLLLSRSASAFDGRYFGPVPLDGLQGVARPVLTW